MKLNFNQIKNLNQLSALPQRERSRASLDKYYYYTRYNHDIYHLAVNYYQRVVFGNIGKDVKEVISILRNNLDYKHNYIFKEYIEDYIKNDLINRFNALWSWSYSVYVDQNNLIQHIENHPDILPRVPYSAPEDTVETEKYFIVEGGITNYILRRNGIHYYITKSYYDELNLKIWQRKITEVLLVDKRRIQLSARDLKKQNLKNIWR